MLKAEGWYGPKTTVYHIELRVRRLREKGCLKTSRRNEKPGGRSGYSALGPRSPLRPAFDASWAGEPLWRNRSPHLFFSASMPREFASFEFFSNSRRNGMAKFPVKIVLHGVTNREA
jgi:hypothetical protein